MFELETMMVEEFYMGCRKMLVENMHFVANRFWKESMINIKMDRYGYRDGNCQ